MKNRNESKITVKRGYECLNACILNWLMSSDVDVNSSDIYFAGESSIINYDARTEELSVNIYEKNFSFMNEFDIKCNIFKTTSCMCIETLKRIVLEEGKLILKTCPEKLGYSSAFALNQNAPHFINILNISKDQKKILVLDGYVPTLNSSVFFGWVPIECILEAWSMKKYEYYTLEWLKEQNSEVIQKKAKENFLETIKRYRSKNQSKEYLGFDTEVKDFFSAFFNRVVNHTCLTEDYVEKFFFKVKVNGFMIDKQMILEKINEESLGLSLKYEKVIDQWNNILLFTRKAIYSNRTERLNQLYKNICNVIEEERTIFECLNIKG